MQRVFVSAAGVEARRPCR